jgi:NIPSNAP
MKRFFLTGLLVAAGLTVSRAGEKATPAPNKGEAPACSSCGGDEPATARRVFELRTYYLNEGKLDDLHTRFRDHTCRLLKKHGAELIGFWTPTDDKDGKGSKLVYLLAFPSREAAKKTWEAFGKDPEWQKVREESHKNGVLVKKVDSVFLEPTDYSAMK